MKGGKYYLQLLGFGRRDGRHIGRRGESRRKSSEVFPRRLSSPQSLSVLELINGRIGGRGGGGGGGDRGRW